MNLEMFQKANNNLAPWIGKLGKLLGVVVNKILKEHQIDLTREQFIVLRVLNEHNGRTQQDLVFITERDKTSFSRLISTMESKNLIERRSSDTDKRIKNVHITNEGRNVLNTTNPIIKSTISKFQKGISEEEIQQTITVLEKIQNNILNEYSI